MTNKTIYTPDEAKEKLDNGEAILVDVRDADDYAKGHIPGAVNIPEMFTTLSMTTLEGLKEMQGIFVPLFRNAGIRSDQTVIVYEECLNTRYGGSCRGYFQLSLMSHRDVGILDGGFTQWKYDGLPVTTETTVTTTSDFESSIRESMLATMDDMVAALDNPGVKLLDVRDKDEWIGYSSSPYGLDFAPRKGRIPGSCWVEWYQFMEPEKKIQHFKSADEIRAICAQVGLYPDDDIIIYCFKGARAANTYIALKMAGFRNIRNYYGSWNEWSRHPELPIHEGVLAA